MSEHRGGGGGGSERAKGKSFEKKGWKKKTKGCSGNIYVKVYRMRERGINDDTQRTRRIVACVPSLLRPP
jgi:hypothetical protein